MILLQTNCDGFWAWPWPLILAFILGVILGWLLSRLFSKNNDDLQGKCDSLQAELDACRSKAKIEAATLAGAGITGASSFTSKTKAAIIDDSIKDDLTIVEGIGPKIQNLLNVDGIWSWKQLSESTESRLQSILNAAGPAYTIHKPKTWAEQASMAHKGDFDKLKKWQNELKGGLKK